MKPNTRDRHWLWGIGLCVVSVSFVVAVVCFLFYQNGGRPPSKVLSEANSDTSVIVPSSSLPTIPPAVSVEAPPQLPRIEFSLGSVEEACGLNDFVPYHFDDLNDEYAWPKSLYDASGNLAEFFSESDECRSALDSYINTINPYLWVAAGTSEVVSPFAFVLSDEPLTFERMFSDPTGDLARVQDALSRPECLLTDDDTNWEMKETCYADAFLNYALFNRFCYGNATRYRVRHYYQEEDNPTPEQDRLMWKQALEDAWIERKCEEFSPELELTKKQYPELVMLLQSLGDPEIKGNASLEILIELAARLGDPTAAFTQPYYAYGGTNFGAIYRDEGYKYGRFSGLLTSGEWQEFSVKKEPSTDRFLRTFKMLALASARRPNPLDEIEFDWEFVARHLCEPPYDNPYRDSEESTKPQSCKEIVHELRQRDIKFAPLLNTLDKFEQVALELEVYE
ncbi:MAG: hypothetical protein F4227_05065 [Gammaproteobacteria bacterium]|nr:hypothetical protein [Gammaproteobacteria bacterium]